MSPTHNKTITEYNESIWRFYILKCPQTMSSVHIVGKLGSYINPKRREISISVPAMNYTDLERQSHFSKTESAYNCNFDRKRNVESLFFKKHSGPSRKHYIASKNISERWDEFFPNRSSISLHHLGDARLRNIPHITDKCGTAYLFRAAHIFFSGYVTAVTIGMRSLLRKRK